MFSAGNAPMWRGTIWYEDGKYPDASRLNEIENTNPGLRSAKEWSTSCSSSENIQDVLTCTQDSDCQSLAGTRLECVRGICVLNRQDSQSCYSHADCSGGKLCSGDGKCVHSVIQFENWLQEDVDFEMHAETCTSSNSERFPTVQYDLYGASPWEKIPDVLDMYGMCSYRNWFSFLEFVDPSDASRANTGKCGTDSATLKCNPLASQSRVSRWWDVLRPHSHLSMLSLWDTGKFRVLPHVCDRDYQHLAGLQGCAPSFSLNSAKRGPLGYINLELEKRMFPGTTKNTYVQTIDRLGYSIVGLGTLPFGTSPQEGYRKAGFLSTKADVFVESSGQSIFKACKTLDQCFVDDFYYNGKVVSRRVYTYYNQQPKMRDWKPSESENCGIFAMEETDRPTDYCLGINPTTHACCIIDPAVAPLYYMLKKNPSLLAQELHGTCNKDDLFGKVPKQQAIFSLEMVQKNIDEIPETYMVPKNDNNLRKATIDSIKTKLNNIMEEFTPEFSVDSAFKYIQVTDCSLKLYEKLQLHTTCQKDQEQDSSPFCTDYAMSSKFRSGLYYFLDFTMTEVPFAWWHKCMLLQSRSFAISLTSANNGIIRCDEWRTSTIPASKMNLLGTNFAGVNAREKLMRVEGGLTSAAIMKTVEDFKLKISKGFKEMSLQTPQNFNLKCFSKASFPMNNVTRFKTQAKPQQDCILDILQWIHNEDSSPETWPSKFRLSSYWSSAAAKSCFLLDEKDLVTYTESGGIVPPLQVINEFLNVGGEDGLTLISDIQFNDFFVHKYNTLEDGLLIAELAPSKPMEAEEILPGDLTEIHGPLDPVNNMAEFKKFFTNLNDEYPCVKVEEIERRLPPCEKNALEPVPLTDKHCEAMGKKVKLEIEEYAQGIQNYPSSFPRKSVTFAHMNTRSRNSVYNKQVCYWDCNTDNRPLSTNDVVHVGLDNATKYVLFGMADVKMQACKDAAKTGAYVYEDLELKQTMDDSLKTALASFQKKQGGVAIQEVCGYEYKLCQDAIGNWWECSAGEWKSWWKSDPKDYLGGNKKIFDTQDKYVENHAYNCKTVKVRSTGSQVVDKVRAGLSYNDIIVSMSESTYSAQTDAHKNEFNQRIFQLISEDTWKSYREGKVEKRRCISTPPTLSPDGVTVTTTRVIDSAFKVDIDGSRKDCLRLATVKGKLECRFYMKDGLDKDASYVLANAFVGNQRTLKTHQKGSSLDWYVEKSMITDPAKISATTSYPKVIYTLWVRILVGLLQNKEASTAWTKPQPLAFYQDNKAEYLDKYTEFNIINRLKYDKRVAENGQNCQGTKPQIDYNKCSKDFTSLYRAAAASFDKYARKHGSTIVPARSALIWPGLAFGFHKGKVVPAWSSSTRPIRNQTARWIFNESQQCTVGDPDNTICASTGSQGINSMEAVIPWLGGDYNPWLVFFAVVCFCFSITNL